ncbi:MAG: hypothetical protein ACRD19_07415, partial [Terriglobia bacterium]
TVLCGYRNTINCVILNLPSSKRSMPLIYVFAASKTEARPALAFAGSRGPVASGAVGEGEKRVVVTITGMGRRNAGTAARAALNLASLRSSGNMRAMQKPDAVLVIGVCGGLTEAVPQGRIVVYDQCLSAEAQHPPLRCSPAFTQAMLETLHKKGIPCDPVTGITSARIATTKSARLDLAKSGAAAVDMESYDVLSAAARAGVPAAVLRVVSDSVDTAMPDFNRALDAKGGIDNRKALAVALCSPFRTLSLMAANRRAMEQLGPTVKWVLQSICFSWFA